MRWWEDGYALGCNASMEEKRGGRRRSGGEMI